MLTYITIKDLAMIASVLNKVLGEFCENIDADNLNVGLFSGTVSLEDLRIKKSVIERMGFPFVIRSGTLKRVFIKIPYTSLTSSPLQVEITGLHLHLETTKKEDWDTSLVQEILSQTKQVNLGRFEILHTPELEVSGSPGFTERLVTKIINNLQVEVNGVYIRLEDRVSSIHPFAVGIALKRVAAVTCNPSWKPEFIQEGTLQYKLVTLEGFSVHLDSADPAKVNCAELVGGFKKLAEKEVALTPPFKHSYMIEPVFLTLKIVINKDLASEEPQFQATLRQSALKMRMEDLHVTHLLKFSDYFSQFNTYCQGVERELTTFEFTEAAAIEYRDLYLRFKQDGSNIEALTDFEQGFRYDDLVKQRLVILEEKKLEDAEEVKLEEIANLQASVQEGYFTGVKSWFGYGKTEQQKKAEEQELKMKIDAARAELESIKDKQSAFAGNIAQFLEESAEGRHELPEDYVKVQVVLELETLQLTLCKEAESMMMFQADGFSLTAGLRVSSVFVEFGLQGTRVEDCFNKSSAFPLLMHGGVFEGRFDQYPHTIIGLRSESLQIVVDLKALLAVARIFREAIAKEVNLDEYTKQAAQFADEYIQSGRQYVQGMLQGDYKYNSVDLRLALKAPVFIFPLDLTRPSDFLVFDLGQLEATTKRIAKVLAVVDYKLIESDDQLYDTYNFTLSDVALSTVASCSEVARWREGKWTPLYAQPELSLKISTCIIQDHPSKPVIRADFIQRDLRVHLSDKQMALLLKLKANGMETFDDFMPKAPEVPVHYIGLKDQIKNFGSVISQTFSFRVDNLVVEALLHDKPLLRFQSQEFSTVVNLGRQGGLSLKLRLTSLVIEDTRPDTICGMVLHNPSQSEVNTEDNPQLSVFVEVRPQDDSTKLSVTLNDLRLSPTPEFASSVLRFYSEPFSEAASTSASTFSTSSLIQMIEGESSELNEPQIKPQPASVVEAQRSLICYFTLTNFEMALPDPQRVLCFNFGMDSSYVSTQHYQYQLDKEGYVQNIEYSYTNDDASVELTHLGLHVLSASQEVLSAMLVPCRITLSYSVQQRMSQVEIAIDIVLESIFVLFGFRDLKQIQYTTARWLEIKPQPSEQAIPESKPAEGLAYVYNLKVQCDSIQLQLTDDTVSQPYSLIFAQVPNFTAAFVYGASLTGLLSVNFKADYYNVPKSVWEPLIEDWELELLASESEDIAIQLVSKQPLSLNLSFQMLQVVSTLSERLRQNEADWGHSLGQSSNISTQASVYNIVNKLGVDALIWVDVPLNTDRWLLKPNEARQMTRSYIEDIINAHSSSRKASLYSLAQPAACIAIEVQTQGRTRGLSLDDFGTKSFMLKEGEQTYECTMTIAVQGREIRVTIESCFQVMNNLDFAVTLVSGEERFTLESLSSAPVPLRWVGSDISVEGDQSLTLLSDKKACVLGGHNITIDSWSIKVKAHEKRKALQTVTQLNPAFVIQNLLPCIVSLHLDGVDEEIALVEPGCEVPVYTLKPSDSAKVQVRLKLGNDRELTTDWISLEKSLDTKLMGNFPAHKLSISVEPSTQLRSSDLDLRFSAIEKSTVKARTVKLYAQFIIVNKTDYDMECGRRTHMPLAPHSFSLFKSNRSKLKIRLTGTDFGEPTKWSDGFNIESVGLAGSVKLSNLKARNKGTGPAGVLLGVVMQNAPPPLIKTKIVYIVPRFIVHNTLPITVHVKQLHLPHTMIIEPGTKAPLQLEDPDQPRLVQFSTDEEHWSVGVNVENIEDFQIKIRCIPSVGKSSKWYEPNDENYYNLFVRVVVISEDDATIFINLLLPRDPEFQVLNLTSHTVSVRQNGLPEYLVTAGAALPFAFDDPENRKVLLNVDNHERAYTFEKVKELKDLHDCKVSCMVVGVTRVLQISEKKKKKDRLDRKALFRYISQSKYIQKGLDLQIQLFAIGLSIIDDSPKECFFMSLSDIQVHARQDRKTSAKEVELAHQLEVKVGHVQLDNMSCKDTQFKVIFCPSLAFGTSEVPFFQFGIHMVSVFPSDIIRSSQMAVESASMDRITLLNISLQEMQVKLDQTTLYEVADLATRLEESMHLVVSEIRRSRNTFLLVPEDSFPFMQAAYPSLSFDATQISRKSYIQNMTIFGVKIVVSLRLSQRKLQLNPSQGFGVLVLLSNFGSALANVSESPLYFKAVIFEHLFQTTSNLTWLMLKNYTRQGLFQFYKVIGSSDLLGNPIGLIDKLGSGVLEFFSEPYKGLLKGPGEFVGGVSKGVRALVGNVIAGGFGSVSKITGSLYNIVHEAGGNEQIQLKEGDNIFTGVYYGFTGGVTELATGLAGFFTKPYQGAKRSGFLGFFKGLGAGIVGAVTAPLAAALRIGSSVATGISNTGTLLSKGKIHHYGRLRFPRQFGVRRVLEPYDEELAQAQELVRTLKDYKRQRIACFVQVEAEVMVILTLKYLLLLTDGDLKKSLKLTAVVNCEVHRIGEVFYFCAATRRNQIVVKSAFYGPLARLYLVMSSLPTSLSTTVFSAKYRFDESYGRSCC